MKRLGFVPFGASLTLLIGGLWTYLATMTGGIRHVDCGMGVWLMPRTTDWAATVLALVFLMWGLMMAAMMLPSILPVVLFVVRFQGATGATGFIIGYVAVWIAFSAVATLTQWAMLQAALVSPLMESTSVGLSVALLAIAGVYQFTSLKQACLTRCRSAWPAVLTPSGRIATVRAGLEHGLYCVGCCWALMALMFVAGVMNLLWAAVITAYVFAEKWTPRAAWMSRAAGAVLCLAAISLLVIAPH
jgi:predicted metal-binding membrane protein